MVGAWREALVEPHDGKTQPSSRYLLHHGRGERRWADGGEIAWHDIAPLQYDVAPGLPMLAWELRGERGCFQAAFLEEPKGDGFVVRFDDGVNLKLGLSALRERWTLPLRVLCRHGDYQSAKVLEALSGLLRVEFRGGVIRWALPEEVLAEHEGDGSSPLGMGMAAVSHVAVWSSSGYGSKYADDAAWQRASLLSDVDEGADEAQSIEVVLEADRSRKSVPLSSIRRPRREKELDGLHEGVRVLVMDGTWLPGIVNGIADDSNSGQPCCDGDLHTRREAHHHDGRAARARDARR